MKRLLSRFVFVIASIAAVGCSNAVAPAATPTAFILRTAIPVVTPSDTPMPTSTPTLVPVPTIPSTPTRTATLAAGTMRVKIFLVAINDNGKAGKKIGCNDSIVAVDRFIPVTLAPLTAALKELFSLTDRTYGQSGLYNALYQSKLKIATPIAIVSGKATINLSGSLVLNGVCDNPRVEAQIKETALQFSTVKTVAASINGIALEKALSEK
ncbi:MAG: hypothetical protein KGJ80_09205 [Chloroflexota bacterium]|nr:hypothetical protein [Chloroflexota bacterium]